MDFGFTNDWARYQAAVIYRVDAVLDGWELKATYDHESMDYASSLKLNGFKMQILTRCGGEFLPMWKYQVSINIWGPDRLAIEPPWLYDFEVIQALMRTCPHCHATNVTTQRVGFAGRTCAACLATRRADVERPGWTS